ncbi:MAG: efflux RND transporter periplasmic adaptor subunit [Planctomycetes bacterium]|nr:efflux RND transporter periplasmic adaptor subunit [Planctomycetota bacterium]
MQRNPNRPLRASACLAALAGLLTASCHRGEHAHHEEIGKLAVTTPVRQSTELTREYVGQIRTIQHIEVRALARGFLQEVHVDEGQLIESGQPMFELLPVIYRAEVGKATAEAERAEIEYRNTKLLADKNIVSPNELALAQANLEKAQAELALASGHASFTKIAAPFRGIMGRFFARKGSLIDEGDLLTTLSDNSTMWVYFNVSEAEYLRFREGSNDPKSIPVRLRMANGELFDQLGRIETIEADFNNETGTIAFRAAFPNPNGLLRHGQTGKVLLSTPLENALLIPQKATFEVLDRKFVFVVDEAERVHARPIVVAAELPQLYVIRDGLGEDDRILLDGLRKVREGLVVETYFQAPENVLAHLEVPAE